MKKSGLILKSLISALAVFVYVYGVALMLSNAKYIFGEAEPKGMFIPVFMLLLLIISATVTGLLVLGKPIHLYFNGQKKEGITLLLSTLGWLVVLLVVVMIVLWANKK